MDKNISTSLPDPVEQPELFNSVKNFQIHHHSSTCWKYQKGHCRFHFGKFVTDKTIVASPLPSTMHDFSKQSTLQWRQDLLDKVSNYINTELNPSKVNIIDPSDKNYIVPKSVDELLSMLEISKDDYYSALLISRDQDFKIHFYRSPNSCFVNHYFEGLLPWQANIDIQLIFNHYKAVTYMYSYFSKYKDECSETMKQAAKETFDSNLNMHQQMKATARAYATKRECSVKEVVYHCLPELHL